MSESCEKNAVKSSELVDRNRKLTGYLLGSAAGMVVGGFVAVDHGLQFHPATPQSDPAREAIALAILVATQARHVHVERFDAWRRS